MSAESHSHKRIYLIIFGALLVLTLLTVGVSYLHLSIMGAVIVAMIIAFTKGSLVGAYFMHLLGEHRLVFAVLAFTAICLVILLAVPLLVTMEDYRITVGQP